MTPADPTAGIWITRLEQAEGRSRLAVKDLFDTAGVRTTYGSAVFRDHVPDRTADAVALLEEAGYVTVGKANLHEFAYGITSQNPHFGTTPNPAAPGRTAGGSSGGCAAAVALGQAELGLGTDSGGSVRIPAACCGIVGFKPTFGTVPMAGCFPLAPSFDHAGPMAADVAACGAAMEALNGLRMTVPDDLADVRIGVAWLDRAEPEVRASVSAASALLPNRTNIELPMPEGVSAAFQAEIAATHRELFAQHEDLYGDGVATKIRRCLAVSDEQAGLARDARERYREAFAAALDGVDLVLAPTLPILPPHSDSDELGIRERMTDVTFALNAVGAPAIALPCGRSAAGVPISLQLIGAPHADGLVLGVAARLEDALRNTPAPRA